MEILDLQHKLEDSFPEHSNQRNAGLNALVAITTGIGQLSALGLNVHLEDGPANSKVEPWPRMVYKDGEEPKVANSQDELESFGEGWDKGPDFKPPVAPDVDYDLVRKLNVALMAGVLKLELPPGAGFFRQPIPMPSASEEQKNQEDPATPTP